MWEVNSTQIWANPDDGEQTPQSLWEKQMQESSELDSVHISVYIYMSEI